MFVTLLAFICSFVVFAIIGVALLLVIRIPRLSVLTFLIFVVSAQIGGIMFLVLYALLFGNSTGELTSRCSVVGLFIGAPTFATLVGWLSALTAARIRDKACG